MRNICIHGHFYQPPRENPWAGLIDREDTALPAHDWNCRVSAECYGPNAFSPVADRHGRTERFENNYEHISFNFGPTLLSWLEQKEPEIYLSIIQADRVSAKKRGGHGNAIAQVYNHVIMPLATAREKELQISWGITDFTARFGREPEGMWLAETAADDATLEALIAAGIRFTVLASWQAKTVRAIGGNLWQHVHETTLDTSRPYRWFSKTGSGKYIDLFFYSEIIAKHLNCQPSLKDPTILKAALLEEAAKGGLAHAATDGEVYGHHMKTGSQALTYIIESLSALGNVRLTNYGQFLAENPPESEAEIVSPSAWSCRHGVGRWKEDCGCNPAQERGWNQKWRGPLRDSLRALADTLDALYEKRAPQFMQNPAATLEAYGGLTAAQKPLFIKHLSETGLTQKNNRECLTQALKLLEMEKMRHLMFTSCGWFFDEISRIEPVQLMKYAACACGLAGEEGKAAEKKFEAALLAAPSNIKRFANGRTVYRKLAKTAARGADKMAAIFCTEQSILSGLPAETGRVYRFKVAEESRSYQNDGARALQLLHAENTTTLEQMDFCALAVKADGALRVFIKSAQAEDFNTLLPLMANPLTELEAELKKRAFTQFETADFPPETARLAEALAQAENTPLKLWLETLKAPRPDKLSPETLAAAKALAADKKDGKDIPFLDVMSRLLSAKMNRYTPAGKENLPLMLGWTEFLAGRRYCGFWRLRRDICALAQMLEPEDKKTAASFLALAESGAAE